jgi:signal transduction histidine kinase
VRVTTDVENDGARVVVSNSGWMVPPSQVDRLFRPFERMSTDRTGTTNGHGLGLSIVAAIAQSHHATVSAQARTGGGLDVTVTFPLDAAAEPPVGAAGDKSPRPVTAAAGVSSTAAAKRR